MSREVASRVVERYGTALAGVLLFAAFAATAPRFLDPTNLLNVLKHGSVLALKTSVHARIKARVSMATVLPLGIDRSSLCCRRGKRRVGLTASRVARLDHDPEQFSEKITPRTKDLGGSPQ